jgi:hypothetical protein
MKKYPSIDQFRNVIRAVKTNHDYQGKDENDQAIYQHTSPYPTLTFNGTVKIHGTNAAIVRYKDGTTKFQSRERELELTSDNMGFKLFMSNVDLDFLFAGIKFNDHIAVYGEWCGKGIQKGVAVSELPRMFVIFGWKIDDVWVSNIIRHNNECGVWDIRQFPTYQIKIDFNNPEQVQNEIIDLTIAVENECPVGKQMGVCGVGEGIVFSTEYNGHRYVFKSVGKKHSPSNRTTLASVDVDELNSINEFVTYALTENRLNQGIDIMKSNDIVVSEKTTGAFLKWVADDIIKEETDTIVQNGLDVKKIMKAVSNKARVWYFNYLNDDVIDFNKLEKTASKLYNQHIKAAE